LGPILDRALENPPRLVYANGEEERIQRLTQQVLGQRIAQPILIGHRSVVQLRLDEMGLSLETCTISPLLIEARCQSAGNAQSGCGQYSVQYDEIIGRRHCYWPNFSGGGQAGSHYDTIHYRPWPTQYDRFGGRAAAGFTRAEITLMPKPVRGVPAG